MHEKSEIVASVCLLLEAGNRESAVNLLQHHAEFDSLSKRSKAIRKPKVSIDADNSVLPSLVTLRRYTPFQSTCLFIHDGFVDRYDGERLVFPGVLRLLSDTFPNEFPYHPNWKVGACHQWYWDLFPTVDHIVPVTLAGLDDPENWVTTSMLNNLTKSNKTLESLGWDIGQRGNFDEWDGLIRWFVKYLESNVVLLRKNYINNWYRAAIKALKTL